MIFLATNDADNICKKISVTHLNGSSTVLEDVVNAEFTENFLVVETSDSTSLFPLIGTTIHIDSSIKVRDRRWIKKMMTFIRTGIMWFLIFTVIQLLVTLNR